MDSHLSRPYVAIWLKPPFEAHRANVLLLSALHRIGFAGPHSLLCAGELLPRLSTLTVTAVRQPYRSQRRYISVALSLGSPPAAVSRYPALRSSDFPQAGPFELRPQPFKLLTILQCIGFSLKCQKKLAFYEEKTPWGRSFIGSAHRFHSYWK